jgi:hypothetical protein
LGKNTVKEVMMKGAASKILIVLGIFLILAAILWWAIAVNALVKLPDDLSIDLFYEGELTYYVNPLTQQRLSEGSELKAKLEVELTGEGDPAQSNSSTVYFPGALITKIQGMPEQRVESALVLDRKTAENVKDDRTYGWQYQGHPGIAVDRSGSYYPVLTFDTSKDKTYPYWKEEVNSSFELEFVNEEEKEGITVYNFKGSFQDREACEPYVQYLSLPRETSFDQIKPDLVAAGFDVDGLMALAAQAMSPEDLQALTQAMQAGLPLKYLFSTDFEVSVEPKTGVLVDVYKDVESISAATDFSKLSSGLAPLLAKYKDNPTLGPAIAKLQGLQAAMDEMPPQKIFEYTLEQTDESVKDTIEDTKKGARAINVAKVYIPWALLIVGALILIVGLLVGGGGVPQEEEQE